MLLSQGQMNGHKAAAIESKMPSYASKDWQTTTTAVPKLAFMLFTSQSPSASG